MMKKIQGRVMGSLRAKALRRKEINLCALAPFARLFYNHD